MNCLEFRRIVLANPRQPGVDAVAHARTYAACHEFLTTTLALEGKIEAALNIDPPARLADRLLASIWHRRSSWRWFALAASFVAAALGLFLVGPRSDPLALAAIDFVVFDEARAVAVAGPQDMRVLAGVSRAMRVSLPEGLGTIHYICVYLFAGGGAHHLLVQTPLGKVTLLLMPDRKLDARAVAAARGLQAAIVPAVAGSIAIIGESSRSIGRVEALLRSS